MKIIGIGVDIVENKRIRSLINKKNFLARTFGKSEILNSKKVKNKVNYFSKRFASKEALSKAIGTGISEGLNFKDIEVANNSHGKPYFLNNFKLKNFIIKKKKIKNFNLFLSISDEKEYSIALAIIQTK
jgi:holo-[acyl-carrier protein] synthase